MSRHSPTGFAFGILMEIAAVVAIVSFLPRIDLRPPAAGGAGQPLAQTNLGQPATGENAISPVSWTQADRGSSDASQASYYQRSNAPLVVNASQAGSFATQAAPPLIELDPARPKYVEQRLDRASQQLVNSVGSAVTQAANDWMRYPPPTSGPAASTLSPPVGQSITAARQANDSPSVAVTVRRPRAGTSTPQPRPWIRY